MSDEEIHRIEVMTGMARRRRWSAEQKLRIVKESFTTGESVSVVARRHGVAPSLLFRWRRLMSEGGAATVSADDGVTSNSEVRKLEEPIRELERQLGRKTREAEILREAIEKSREKIILLSPSRKMGDSR